MNVLERRVPLTRDSKAASSMKQDAVERAGQKQRSANCTPLAASQTVLFLQPGASPGAAFIDPTCSSFGEYERPDWFVIFWSAVVVVGVGFCALKFFGVM